MSENNENPPAPCDGCMRNFGDSEVPVGHVENFTVVKEDVGLQRHGTCHCVGGVCQQDVPCRCQIKFKITMHSPSYWRIIPANQLTEIERTLLVEQCGDKQSWSYVILHFPAGDGHLQGAQPDGVEYGNVKIWVSCDKCEGNCG